MLLRTSSLSMPAAFPFLTIPLTLASVVAVPINSPHIPQEAASQMNVLLNLLPASARESIADGTGFTPGFIQSLLLILACELGDRTFFVAAILAMKSSRIIVWCGALAALAAMTVLSAAIGKAFPLLLDKQYTQIAAAALFGYFGIQLLREWWKMRGQNAAENEELAEVEEELNADDNGKKALGRNGKLSLMYPIFMKAFTMTALAEWGDRSQIATIALAAAKDLYGVILGGILGHAICTGLAVVGGRLLATKISERAVALMGGILFIIFAFITAGGYMD